MTFKIDGTKIGGSPYFIAEMSGNHNGDIARAFEIIAAAKAAGADALKIQTYTADTITLDHDGPGFILDKGLWQGRKLYDLYKEAMTPWEWHGDLFDCAKETGITIFSSPFDFTAVDLLEKLGAPAYKIASFEIVDIPLIKYVAQTGKPIIISTGLANIDEIGEAVEAAGKSPLALLHCVSGYPAPAQDMNLKTIVDLAARFGVLSGLSDHSEGISVPVAATVMGAVIIEKHMTLSRADGGVDSDFSLEHQEFAEMVRACKTAYEAIGSVNYDIKESEEAGRDCRRSLYVSNDVKKGEIFTADNVRSVRPGFGMAPKYLDDVIGKCATKDVCKGDPLHRDMVGAKA